MDEKKMTGLGPENRLTEPELAEELQAAESDMAAAGLTHPEQSEMERILEEARELAFVDYSEPEPEQTDPEQTYADIPEVEGEPFAYDEPEEAYDDIVDDGGYEEESILPPRKGRPKRRGGAGLLGIPHILVTAVWLALCVIIGISLGRIAWVSVSDVMAFGREQKEIVVTIDESDTIEDIAQKLKEQGLIRYPKLFELYSLFSSAREDISAGTFTLNTIYDYHALVNSMSYYSSTREEITVMIPEGYTCEQIFALLEEKGVCKAVELEAYAAGGELDEYWFLSGVQRGEANCLEGFLFPDTYNFYLNDSPEAVLEKLLDTFDYRFSEAHQAQLETLNETLRGLMQASGKDEAYIADNLLDVRDVVTIASLIEKETAGADESATIASVIYNRLYDWGDTPRYLNIDAALMYVLGHKEALTNEDLQVDSPYNTYTHTGLVPGPIANPGLNSIEAALEPADTNYYYYVLDPETGDHLFASTASEHEANVAKVSQGD